MDKNTKELLELIKENPDLPILPMVNYEVCGGDFAYWTGYFSRPVVDEFVFDEWYGDGCVRFKSDGDEDSIIEGIAEHCIFGSTHKRLPYKVIDEKRQQGITGFYEPKTIHSRKPETMREMIEKVSYAPRIELFARQEVSGWDCWGNEV